MNMRLTRLLLSLFFVLPDVSDCVDLGIYTSLAWTDHRQFERPLGVGLVISKSVTSRMSLALDVSHRTFHNNYYGERVSRHPASIIKVEPVDNLSYASTAMIWIKNRMLFFNGGAVVFAAGAGPLAIDGRIVGKESGRAVLYKGLNKVIGTLALGIESSLSEKTPTFWNFYIGYQFLSASVRVIGLTDPFRPSISGPEIRLGLSHIF